MNADIASKAISRAAERGAANLRLLLGIDVELGEPRLVDGESPLEGLAGKIMIVKTGFTHGEAVLALPSEQAVDLIETMLSGVEHRSEDVLGELGISALSEAMRQLTSGVAEEIAEATGSDAEVGEPEVDVIDAGSLSSLSATPNIMTSRTAAIGRAHARLFVGMTPEAATTLASTKDRSHRQIPDGPDAVPQTASALGRLAEVKLDVAVELGRSQVPIHELLALDEGGVIRLGKRVGEPVDLMVNGLPTARGEIVVVDGRLGLRVTELIA